MKINWGRRAVVLAIGVTSERTFVDHAGAGDSALASADVSSASSALDMDREGTHSERSPLPGDVRRDEQVRRHRTHDRRCAGDQPPAVAAPTPKRRRRATTWSRTRRDYVTGGQFAPADRYAGRTRQVDGDGGRARHQHDDGHAQPRDRDSQPHANHRRVGRTLLRPHHLTRSSAPTSRTASATRSTSSR